MEKLHNKKAVDALVAQAGIHQYFSTPGLQFFACRYQKGELITAPDQKLETILFVIEGTVRIFGIRPDGTSSPVNQQNPPVILGDIEFSEQGACPFFTQATTDVLCLGLPVKPYEKELHRDLRFLHVLLHSYAEKLQFFAFVDAPRRNAGRSGTAVSEKLLPQPRIFRDRNGSIPAALQQASTTAGAAKVVYTGHTTKGRERPLQAGPLIF